jgi:LuxR family maltose regulon positive regulatory protein
VLSKLDLVLAAAREAGRGGSVVDALVVRALAREARGDRDGALTDVGRALADAVPHGYARLFLDEGPALTDLLRTLAARPGRAGAAEAAALVRLDQGARTGATGGTLAVDSPGSGDDALSSRELEVLRLLATELTGPEIARQLYVSVNTLRTHTRHIFTKLDVNTRPAAVRRATDLGLL